jgi:uncharacterized iron-regulated membrane protein
MTTRLLRRWAFVHKWSSLVSTIFLLMLCITGLLLIFRGEIDALLLPSRASGETPATGRHASLDDVVASGMRARPGEFVQFLVWDREDPNLIVLSMATSPEAAPDHNSSVRIDARNAEALGANGAALTEFLLKLHTEMFAGMGGKLFLGLMGFLFVVAIVSGVVLYGPFMRKLSFGTVRQDKSARLRWLDLHNLIGIVTLSWALVVGTTGVINTWADVLVKVWQYTELTDMVGPYKSKPLVTRTVPLDAVVATARATLPEMTPYFIAMPGSLLTSTTHFAVFMRGETPLTSRLLKPVLIDAETGKFTDTRELPWYIWGLQMSQPLHFGDYGGLPLKVLWAVLDLATIIVLGSGLYLWLSRGRTKIEQRIDAAEAAGTATAAG